MDKSAISEPRDIEPGDRWRAVYAWFSGRSACSARHEWKGCLDRHLGQEYSPFDLDLGHASSPALFRDRLILICYEGSAAFLLALDKQLAKSCGKWIVLVK